MVGGVCMRRKVFVVVLVFLIVVSSTTVAFASLGDMSLKALFKSFIRYDFDSVKEVSDKNGELETEPQNPSPSETVHKDGKYTVESKPDYEGYYSKATVIIKDGKIKSIDWNIYDSKKRVFDEAYEEVFGNNQHYREQCRKDLSGSKIYGPKLIQVQNIDEVDAISGATWANKKFKEVVKLALEQANVDN